MQHVYAENPLNRGERERRDEAWIADRLNDPKSKFLPMWQLRVLVRDGDPTELCWVGNGHLKKAGNGTEPVLLGLLVGVTYFAIDIGAGDDVARQFEQTERARFEDCRTVAGLLSPADAGIVAQARAQIDWHNRCRFCSVCGSQTETRRGGQQRACLQCRAEHFPRTDPVVITVVSDEDRCLLGQSAGRMARSNMYSALAGFVDQGESIEEAVAREIMEEAGVRVGDVRYHSSQPWPFPSSLMIGCHAHAVTTSVAKDEVEMSDVRWFRRDEVLAALEGKNEELSLPGPFAIAHHLIKDWAMGKCE